MSNFSKLAVTKTGLNLINKNLTTENRIVFTRMAASDHPYSLGEIEELEMLEDIKQYAGIRKMERTDEGIITVDSLFGSGSGELAEGYFVRTVGLFADDGGTEILFAAAVDITEHPAFMLPANTTVTSMQIKFRMKLDNAENVEINVDTAGMATIGDVVDVLDRLKGHESNGTVHVTEEDKDTWNNILGNAQSYTDEGIKALDTAIKTLQEDKQDSTDESLVTSDKTIVGAINEAYRRLIDTLVKETAVKLFRLYFLESENALQATGQIQGSGKSIDVDLGTASRPFGKVYAKGMHVNGEDISDVYVEQESYSSDMFYNLLALYFIYSEDAGDVITNSGRGGTRASSEPAFYFMFHNGNPSYPYCGGIIGKTLESVTLTNLTQYGTNSISQTKDGYYINRINTDGQWQGNGGVVVKKSDGTQLYTTSMLQLVPGSISSCTISDILKSVVRYYNTSLSTLESGNVFKAVNEVFNKTNLKSRGIVSAPTGATNVSGMSMSEAYNNGYPIGYGNIITLRGVGGAESQLLLGCSETNKGIKSIYYRNKRDVSNAWSDWRQVAFTTDNVASATKATQDGNGKVIANTYLPLAGGTMIGIISSSVNTGTYLAGNQGGAIINSTAPAGSFTMLAKMNSTNGYFIHGAYKQGYVLFYTAKPTVDAGINSPTKSATLLDEAGNSAFPGEVSAADMSVAGEAILGQMYVYSGNTGIFHISGANAKGQSYPHLEITQYSSDFCIRPTQDNRGHIGDPSYHLMTMYANNIYNSSGLITSSDRRKKKDFEDITKEFAEQIIDGLVPASFKYKDGDSGRTHYGLIAQDVEELLGKLGIDSKDFAPLIKNYPTKEVENEDGSKTLVTDYDAEPEYYLRYEGFTGIIIKYIQGLRKENTAMKDKMKELEDRLELLESKLNNI